jgi:predicted transglutaminase-like cysteine proteinase
MALGIGSRSALRIARVALLGMVGLLFPAATFAGSTVLAHTGPTDGPLFGDDVPPTVGAALWCNGNLDEPFCKGVAAYTRVTLNSATAAEISKVNTAVNVEIEPVDDMVQWHVPEKWSRPARGADGRLQDDCDGYVIEKWYRLVQEDHLPASAFYPLYAEVPGYGGHLVLALVTNKGTYILDNLHENIVPMDEFKFTYLKRPRQGHRLEDGWERYFDMGVSVASATAQGKGLAASVR